MGGFTKIQLVDVSEENIDKQNAKLDEIGLRKEIRFSSNKEIVLHYEAFVSGEGVFKESLFPSDKINSFEDFKKYWLGLGEVFVPPIGSLGFDCYFGRTSARAMNHIGKYVVENHKEIKSTSGSWSTFIERAGLSKASLKVIEVLN